MVPRDRKHRRSIRGNFRVRRDPSRVARIDKLGATGQELFPAGPHALASLSCLSWLEVRMPDCSFFIVAGGGAKCNPSGCNWEASAACSL